MDGITRGGFLSKQKLGERFIMQKLGLVPNEAEDYATNHREYSFALFLLRYRIADVASWMMKGGPPVLPNVLRTPLPPHADIVRL